MYEVYFSKFREGLLEYIYNVNLFKVSTLFSDTVTGYLLIFIKIFNK